MNAELEKYNKAIKLFEDVAKKSVDNNSQVQREGLLAPAGICHLCMGPWRAPRRPWKGTRTST